MARTRRLVGVVIALASVAGVAAQTDHPDAVDPASWVPADALFYVGIADVHQLVREIKQTAFAKMMQDPAARDAWGQATGIYRFYQEFRKRLARALGTEPDQLENPFGGPLAVFVPMPRDPRKEDLRAVLIAGVGNAALMRTYYDQAVQNLAEIADQHEQVAAGPHAIDRFVRSTAEFEGTSAAEDERLDLTLLDAGDESFAQLLDQVLGTLFSAESMPRELALCLSDERLIVAPSLEHARHVLDRAASDTMLTAAPGFKKSTDHFEQLGTVRFYANVHDAFELMRVIDGDEARHALRLLGAESVQTLGGHIHCDLKQYESKLEVFVVLAGERAGLPKIFSMPNAPVAPPARIPADALVFASANVQPASAVDEIARMIYQDDPQAAEGFRAGLEAMPMPDGDSLNVRKTVLDNLDGPLVYSLSFRTPYGPQSTCIELTLGHSDQAAISRFLSCVSVLAPGMAVARDEGENVVVDLPLAGFSITATDDLILAGTTGVVESALRGSRTEPGLAENPLFRKAVQFVPQEAWGVLYVDSRRMFEAAIELGRNRDTLRAGKMTNLANLITLSMVEALTRGLADDEAACQRMLLYQAPSITTVSTEPDGLRLVQIQLLPEQPAEKSIQEE